MNIFFNIVFFITGSCVGSFLNVCIWRFPKNISLVRPSSFCPQCNTPIRWYDNVPILSYLFLRAKCRTCGKKISIRYPIVELLGGLLFLVLYTQAGFGLSFVKYAIFFCLLIVVSFIDIDYHAIPVHLCLLGIVVGLTFALGESFRYMKTGLFEMKDLPIVGSLKGLVFGLGFTYLFKLFGDVFITFYLNWRKKDSIEGEKESLGLGDVDFMGMVGVYLGASAVPFVFFLAPFLALVYSVCALIFKKSHLIPYLPYLSLATLIVYFWGGAILHFVLK
ncbi:MAG: prepilin peptidase [Candidatus Omnitrophota bacterium]|nr:MAG: prepilin peptidase [Candidatus Omnitrophota bacterium]